MKVKIFKKDSSTPLPEYKTPGSAAFDISASEDITIPAHEIALVPTGLIVCTPDGYALIAVLRSSTPMKKGLCSAHGIGIIDQDYCGPDDEIKIQVYNFTNNPVEIKKGERIAQGMFVKIDKAEWEELNELSTGSRGGFGSTG